VKLHRQLWKLGKMPQVEEIGSRKKDINVSDSRVIQATLLKDFEALTPVVLPGALVLFVFAAPTDIHLPNVPSIFRSIRYRLPRRTI
jgi:hypothetical protein